MRHSIKWLNRGALMLGMFLMTVMAIAHGGHDKDKKQDSTHHATVSPATANHATAMPEQNRKLTADLDDFPNLHPLVVHFAIVLLLAGAFLQTANIYFMRPAVAWTAFSVAATGVLAAYLAGGPYHAHTHNLPEHATLVLAQHDRWADWTLYAGLAGVVLQGTNLFYLSRNRWAVAAVAAVLMGSGYSVAKAGHYGSQLVYIEGVGPQGKYVESEDGDDH